MPDFPVIFAGSDAQPGRDPDDSEFGPAEARKWLSRHGAEYGLCQIYRNEPWHYELRPEAVHHGCPPMYADPAQDPRMRK